MSLKLQELSLSWDLHRCNKTSFQNWTWSHLRSCPCPARTSVSCWWFKDLTQKPRTPAEPSKEVVNLLQCITKHTAQIKTFWTLSGSKPFSWGSEILLRTFWFCSRIIMHRSCRSGQTLTGEWRSSGVRLPECLENPHLDVSKLLRKTTYFFLKLQNIPQKSNQTFERFLVWSHYFMKFIVFPPIKRGFSAAGLPLLTAVIPAWLWVNQADYRWTWGAEPRRAGLTRVSEGTESINKTEEDWEVDSSRTTGSDFKLHSSLLFLLQTISLLLYALLFPSSIFLSSLFFLSNLYCHHFLCFSAILTYFLPLPHSPPCPPTLTWNVLH